ncbi:hypothetical protein D3C78_1461820 [compost metagenome]
MQGYAAESMRGLQHRTVREQHRNPLMEMLLEMGQHWIILKASNWNSIQQDWRQYSHLMLSSQRQQLAVCFCSRME